ncbi:28 kDa ribonucleoprotein, chloroplastic-like [Vicia villosa]|uniref:28 kDa ribonucleoprotein, chloroplastic-like n=1 Tax=Vicia villosa TaxID=3911 RepID=UPI00273C85D3|nr:28 kDa ribonucleoprotein, chloroplastic-like [Vicia villosa]
MTLSIPTQTSQTLMALLRIPSPQLSTKHHHDGPIITSFSSIDFNKNKNYSINPKSIHSLRLSITHTQTLITTKQHPNFTLRFSQQQQQQTQITEEDNTQELSTTRLLAQNVPWTSTAEDIRTLFEKHGKVVDVELSMYNKSRSRGLAFVEMASPEEALAVFNTLQSYEYEGRVINLKYARPRKEKTPPPVEHKPITFNLFVSNLSYETRSKDLKEFFDSGASGVVSAEVIFRENPRTPSGYGFVSFKTKKEANDALSEFQGKKLKGRPIRVAPSKRFIQLAEESAVSEDTSSESSASEAVTEKAD